MNAILDELTQTVFMHVYSTCLPMMDVAFDNGWICTSLHLEPGYSIIVNVVLFEVTLKKRKQISYLSIFQFLLKQ